MTRSTQDLNRWLVIGAICVSVVLGPPMRTASSNELFGGIGDLVNGVLAIPAGVLGGTLNGPPIIGTIGGALRGALATLGYTARGALRLMGVAIPLAAKAAPLIPIFL